MDLADPKDATDHVEQIYFNSSEGFTVSVNINDKYILFLWMYTHGYIRRLYSFSEYQWQIYIVSVDVYTWLHQKTLQFQWISMTNIYCFCGCIHMVTSEDFTVSVNINDKYILFLWMYTHGYIRRHYRFIEYQWQIYIVSVDVYTWLHQKTLQFQWISMTNIYCFCGCIHMVTSEDFTVSVNINDMYILFLWMYTHGYIRRLYRFSEYQRQIYIVSVDVYTWLHGSNNGGVTFLLVVQRPSCVCSLVNGYTHVCFHFNYTCILIAYTGLFIVAFAIQWETRTEHRPIITMSDVGCSLPDLYLQTIL